MAMLYNRARMTVTSTGTGALSLGVAVAGYQTFSSAGAQNNDVVSYAIEDGLKWEIGTGTYNSVAGTLSRTVTQSFDGTTYGTTAISVTTSAQVFISPLAADLTSTDTLTSGTLPVTRGGTGLTSLTAGRIPYGNGTSAFSNSANLIFDGTNLGIGTSSPAQKLHVYNSSTPCRLRVDDATTAVDIFSSSGGGYIGTSTNHILGLVTNGTERMRIDTSGNLLVGSTNSWAKVTVENGSVAPLATPSSNWGIDFAPNASAATKVTIANNGTYDLASGSGLVYVTDDGGGPSGLLVSNYGTTSIIWQYSTDISTTQGTASKLNFYWNSGTSKYRFENKLGSSRSFFITTIRTRLSG